MLEKMNRKYIARMIIVAVIGVSITAFIFRGEVNNMMLKNESYTDKNILITQETLMHDIEIVKAIEGIQGQVLLLKNDENLNKWWDKSFLNSNGHLLEGNIIHVGINNRLFADSKKPLEVQFIIRIMLYLRERNTDKDVGNIVGIAGGFTRNANEVFEGSQEIKMSVAEFEELYNKSNVSGLDINEQVEVLTNIWIDKTNYWRRGLFGEEEKR